MNWPAIKKFLLHCLYGMFAAGWNGGISAVAGIAGIDGVSLTGVSTDARILNLHEMEAAFVGAFGVHIIIWLSTHKLPDSIQTEAPFPPTKS